MITRNNITGLILVMSIFFGHTIDLFAQSDTSPSYRVNGNWVMKENKRFFVKIAGYFYIERLPEYENLLKEKGAEDAFNYINSAFNVLMLPSWPLFLVDNGYQKLAHENCYHPAFGIDHPNGYYKNVRSSDKIALMTQTTYMMDILRYAGLNNFRGTTGYFNTENVEKKENNRWVLGPRDMRLIAQNPHFQQFFGSKNSWGHFQLNVANGLMRDRGQFFWFLSDEPERNGNDWSLPADALRKISETLVSNDLDNICLLSFGPAKYGNKYLFSKENPDRIPENDRSSYSNGYFFSYGGNYDGLRKNFTNTLKYYENIGNVFGINDYSLINENPAYAGYFVDWIREEKGEVPIWIWVAPYLKVADYSLLRCQIFSAVIHGASGIGFWLMKEEDVSDPQQLYKAIRLSQELKLIEPILTADPAIELMNQSIWLKMGENIHFTIRVVDPDIYAILAVNTSKVKSETFELSFNTPYSINIKKELSPMEFEIFF